MASKIDINDQYQTYQYDEKHNKYHASDKINMASQTELSTIRVMPALFTLHQILVMPSAGDTSLDDCFCGKFRTGFTLKLNF